MYSIPSPMARQPVRAGDEHFGCIIFLQWDQQRRNKHCGVKNNAMEEKYEENRTKCMPTRRPNMRRGKDRSSGI
jgi:hypothetical protein